MDSSVSRPNGHLGPSIGALIRGAYYGILYNNYHNPTIDLVGILLYYDDIQGPLLRPLSYIVRGLGLSDA